MNHNLNELAKRIHELNIRWWQDPATGQEVPQNPMIRLMLVVTELSEAVEGWRRDLMDDKLTARKMVEVEMADAFIRILDFSAGFQIPLYNIEMPGWEMPTDQCEAIFDIVTEVVAVGACFKGSGHFADRHLSRSVSMIRHFCWYFQYDIEGAMEEKLAYNARRHDHTHEARLQPGGKKC